MPHSAPHIYQINTWTWLAQLSQTYGRSITLGTIPAQELEKIAQYGVNMVWLMGVWQRSARGVEIAREHPGLQGDYRRALPDYRPEDVVGSPYSIGDYKIDPHLGTRADLATLRQQLAQHHLGLILDFVPNHVATDHPWTHQHPEYLLPGTAQESAQHLHDFFTVGTHIFAHGRDPYFPAWTDTAQVNAWHPGLRHAYIDILRDIASQCDGVRCDMAMLVTNTIFQQTWGERGGPLPKEEFWPEIIPAVKSRHPDFLFLAEVYWEMETTLQQQGFDYCYDKSLYDKLVHGTVHEVLQELAKPILYQQRLIRFIENHDEQRAMREMGFNRAWVAAIVVATLPGAKLWHEGQFVGHRIKLPVQLGRRPVEPDDEFLAGFYRILLQEAQHPIYQRGRWQLCIPKTEWNPMSLIAWEWVDRDERRLIVVNLSAEAHQCAYALPNVTGRRWLLRDIINNKAYERDGDTMDLHGLFVDLPAWSAHIFHVKPLA
jgi:hypothetical protein